MFTNRSTVIRETESILCFQSTPVLQPCKYILL